VGLLGGLFIGFLMLRKFGGKGEGGVGGMRGGEKEKKKDWGRGGGRRVWNIKNTAEEIKYKIITSCLIMF